jgi:hypothetical protein
MKLGIVCVREFSGRLTEASGPSSLYFVNFFAVPLNCLYASGFSGIFHPTSEVGTRTGQGLQAALEMRSGLARMLRLTPGEMTKKICLATYDTIWMGQPVSTAETPRGPSHPRGVLFLISFVKFFTDRWVPQVARSGAERKDQHAELCDPGQM